MNLLKRIAQDLQGDGEFPAPPSDPKRRQRLEDDQAHAETILKFESHCESLGMRKDEGHDYIIESNPAGSYIGVVLRRPYRPKDDQDTLDCSVSIQGDGYDLGFIPVQKFLTMQNFQAKVDAMETANKEYNAIQGQIDTLQEQISILKQKSRGRAKAIKSAFREN